MMPAILLGCFGFIYLFIFLAVGNYTKKKICLTCFYLRLQLSNIRKHFISAKVFPIFYLHFGKPPFPLFSMCLFILDKKAHE